MNYHRFGRIHLRCADVYAFGYRIIRADFKEVALTREDLEELYEAYASISDGAPYVLLADGRTPASMPEDLADLRTELESRSKRIANAIITNSYWSNVLQNLGLSTLMKTTIPCRYFSEIEQALSWCREQVEHFEQNK